MTPTDKVLGSVAAIQTLIEKFPMNILDYIGGVNSYTSVFEYLVDVLNACGVNTNEIMEYLLSSIFGIEAKITNGIEGLYDEMLRGNISVEEQSKFLNTLEYSMKGIMMGLLTGLFTCSALPVLPNKTFDLNKALMKSPLKDAIAGRYFDNQLSLPIRYLDPFNILQSSPLTSRGSLYYSVDGSVVYYRKDLVMREEYVTERKTVASGTTYATYEDTPIYGASYGVGIKCVIPRSDDSAEDCWKFFIEEPISEDITISVRYAAYGGTPRTWTNTIHRNSTETKDMWICSPRDLNGKITKIISITLNGRECGGSIVKDGGKSWVYLSKDSFDKGGWTTQGNIDSVKFGEANNDIAKAMVVHVADADKEVEITTLKNVTGYTYTKCDMEEAEEGGVKMMNFVKENPDENDEEYISHYEGANPNTLYKSSDMNAFIWYVMNKGVCSPQIEYNHMMWDSRISAKKNGGELSSNADWNTWYNSKKSDGDELHAFYIPQGNSAYTGSSKEYYYPIIQLEPDSANDGRIIYHIPSQKYFTPSVKKRAEEGKDAPQHPVNASIYEWDWDYLNNIRILNAKSLVTRMVEELIGFSVDTANSTSISLTSKMIRAKLSKAIKNIIEMDDMEVEDCYMSFSNDEFNEMLNDMMMEKYQGTAYNGETSVIRQHDVNAYVSALDSINKDATSEGTITQIKRLMTEVSTDPCTEASISYGISLTSDGSFLKRLLWAIVLPIVESLFTPQVMLLILINFNLMGIVSLDDLTEELSKIMNLLLNKMLGMIRSIILFVKDKIIELLLKLFYEKALPMLYKYELLLMMERIEYWLEVLKSALVCLPTFKFKRRKIISSIDDVDYADIINNQNIPETGNSC